MIFHQILLQIFTILNNERTVSSAYHLLKGKRSGQTIQDVGIFKLHSYFGLLPKLDRKRFDVAIDYLQQNGQITVESDGFYTIHSEQVDGVHELYFNGWRYRGNEHVFFARLSLLVETLSHVKDGVNYFAPTEKNTDVQRYIRHYLKQFNFQHEAFRRTVFEEIYRCLASEAFTNEERTIVVNRLSGNNMPGYTWKQIAFDLEAEQLDVYFIYISALHRFLNEIDQNEVPHLKQLVNGIAIDTPLTETAQLTANYVAKGYTIEQIANARQLKMSTIEDHIVEMAMNIPDFSLASFMTQYDFEKIIEASSAYDTKKLRILKEVLPQYSYFQLRLALAKGE